MFLVFFLIDMSKLEKAIVAIVEVFEEYAGTDDQKTQLSNAELGQLMKAQITSPEFKVRISEMHRKRWSCEKESYWLEEVNTSNMLQHIYFLIKCCAVVMRCYHGNLAWEGFTLMSHSMHAWGS